MSRPPLDLLWEQHYPYFASTAVAYLYVGLLHFVGPGVEAGVLDAVSEVVGITGTLVGFLATIAALFFALPDRHFVLRAAECGSIRGLVGYIRTAISYGVAAFLLGLGLIVFTKASEPAAMSFMLAAWVWVVSTAFACFYRAASLSSSLLIKTLDSFRDRDEAG